MEEQSEEDFCNSFPELSPTKEYSSNKRFSRTSKILAEGKFKTVFLGYDHDSGREIAWSAIKMHTLKARDKDRLMEDFKMFSKLDHPSILKMVQGWEDPDKNQIITITELTTCSLKQYLRKKMRNIRFKVIKGWCKNILEAIKYLHSKAIIHKNIKCENIFIGSSDGNIRIGIVGNSSNSKNEGPAVDLKSLASCLIEMCTLMDLDYSKVISKHPPRELMMIENEKIKCFVNACYTEDSAESLLAHSFFKPDESNDFNPIKLVPIEELYEISTEEIPKTCKFYISIKKNHEALGRYEFNSYEDVAEQVAETIISKHNIPLKYFQEILNAIEQQMHKINHLLQYPTNYMDYISNNPRLSNPFSLASELKFSKKQKISLNLGIQDVGKLKKIKLELQYDPEFDSPQSVAEEIISHFQLDPGELRTICKLISEKVYTSESETHSNYSNQDLLELFQEEVQQSRPGPNSTMEFSAPSENSSRRSSCDPYNLSENSKSRSLSPIDEDEKVIVCSKGRKNDPRDVKQLQEALGNILGFRIQSDGVFCQKTEKQVKLFQEEFGFPQNGIVDNKLWSTIMIRAFQNHATNLL